MFNIYFKGLRLIPSRTAARELMKCGFMIEDCKEILEKGYSPRKRKKGTIEKWVGFRNKIYNVVVVKSFNYMYNEDVYLIKHFGGFTRKKSRRKLK